MKIIIAENSGLCYGVQRALSLAYETRRQKNGKVCTFGDLIHNPQVISDLNKSGVISISQLDQIREGTVIIRSHGVSPNIYKQLAEKNIEIIDATCPIVKKIQKLVERLAHQKKEIVIIGNKEHPEIQGLIGYSRGKGIIIENEAQAARLPQKRKRAVLVQSTQDIFLFKKIVAALIDRTSELDVHNTICQSTQTRQKSTSELASRADVLFIIGGKNSSNSYKLFEISKRILSATYFIENAEQITPEMLLGANITGLSGGASTPPEAIQEAVNKIRASFVHQYHRENIVQ